MKWTIQFANLGLFKEPDAACLLAQAAEEAGFDSLSACEHVVVPADYQSSYPFSKDGKMGDQDHSSAQMVMPDPLIWIAYVAKAASRIRFTTGVVVLPLHNPIVYAKQLATLDQLCRGRLSLGVGIGWLREEFEALGVGWARRGKRCDEYIGAMRALWREEPASFEGEFVNFRNLSLTPKPVQPGGAPIIVGGHSEAAARRAGRLGDGFFPAIFPNSALKTQLPALIRTMREAAREAGRDPDEIEITSGGARRAEDLGWFRDQGIGRMVIRVRSGELSQVRDELLRFGDEVIGRS